MASPETIAIVGAGYTGALLAVQLLRRTPARVLLIERRSVFGLGLAYGTGCPAHLLNVRSGRMSAFPDDASHFVRWLQDNRPELADPDGFAPRMVYGEYVRATLDAQEAASPGRFERVSGEVTAIDADGQGVQLKLADGRRLSADRCVLALGNAPPDPAGAAGLTPGASDRFINDPWAPGALATVKPADEVLLIGSGLTMIDVALALDAQGWLGRALALSRRGLLPRPHDATQSHAQPWPPVDASLSQRAKAFRARARTIGWGEAMDEIRPFNQALWRAADSSERRRFLRHLRPWWDVHRHRTATEIGARIQAMIEARTLSVGAGRVVKAETRPAGVWIDWRPRGATETRHDRFDRVINCTGPLSDLNRSPDPLHRDLLDRGVARIDRERLGLDVDAGLRVIDGEGRAHRRLYAVGPITRGEAWEIIAVPEIRGQVAELAERFARG
ncbi:MAG: FAD/NAD(P)-binding protein [Proteobacteria bacterium]|nr:FAD/NAD(P)-binding protein [Pseudomonadota bacterium]